MFKVGDRVIRKSGYASAGEVIEASREQDSVLVLWDDSGQSRITSDCLVLVEELDEWKSCYAEGCIPNECKGNFDLEK